MQVVATDRAGKALRKIGLRGMYDFLDRDPEENLPKLIDWLDEYVPSNVLVKQRQVFRNIIENREGNWYKLLLSLWDDIEGDVRKTMFENIVINSNALAAPRAQESRKNYSVNIPWVLALELGLGEKDLDFDEWDSVVTQAKELGTYSFLFQGDEPLEAKEQLIALTNKHSEAEFMVFTDGEKLDEDFAKQVLRVRNVIVTLKMSHSRKSESFDRACRILRESRLPFAVSVLYDAETQDEFANEPFFDDMIDRGVKMIFFLSKIGMEEDRVYQKQMEFRKTKPLLSINFCKDRDMIGGCVAGGRYYCNINAEGDVQPCFFVSHADANLRNMSLLDAYRAPLFMSWHDHQTVCPVTGEKPPEKIL